MQKNPNKILMIRLGAIGDIIHTIATYDLLFNNINNVLIDYLTSPPMEELLNNDIRLNKIIPLTEYSYKGFYKTAQKLSSSNYDLILNLQPSIKTKFFNLLINKKLSLNYKKYWPNHYSKHIHAVENFLNTLNTIIPNPTPPEKLELYLNKHVLLWAQNKLRTENANENLIGIIPGVSNNKRGRLWPKEYWKDLLDYLCNQKKFNIVILGGLNEQVLGTELQEINKTKIHNYCGKLNIMQTACILSLCQLVIGGDTGPTHIATAVGPTVIGLYGATAPKRTGLYGKKHKIIYSSNECLFCEKKTCPNIIPKELYTPCMLKLTVNKVIETLEI